MFESIDEMKKYIEKKLPRGYIELLAPLSMVKSICDNLGNIEQIKHISFH